VARKFAVVGGTALHARLGQAWWDHLTGLIARHFKEERYTEGLVAALEEAGRSLKTHFPGADPHQGRPEVIED
jgi:uncharacterized membrane protein